MSKEQVAMHQFLTAIFLFTSTHSLNASPHSAPKSLLLTYSEMSALNEEALDNYLEFLANYWSQQPSILFDKVMTSPLRSNKSRRCFSGVYGTKVVIENPDLNAQSFCHSHRQRNTSYFIDQDHELEWSRFSFKMALLCNTKKINCTQIKERTNSLRKGST